jgi:hypothetical protein
MRQQSLNKVAPQPNQDTRQQNVSSWRRLIKYSGSTKKLTPFQDIGGALSALGSHKYTEVPNI